MSQRCVDESIAKNPSNSRLGPTEKANGVLVLKMATLTRERGQGHGPFVQPGKGSSARNLVVQNSTAPETHTFT